MTDGKVESLSLDDEGGLIKLISKDGKEFSIEKKYAFVSTLVKTSLETGQPNRTHSQSQPHQQTHPCCSDISHMSLSMRCCLCVQILPPPTCPCPASTPPS